LGPEMTSLRFTEIGEGPVGTETSSKMIPANRKISVLSQCKIFARFRSRQRTPILIPEACLSVGSDESSDPTKDMVKKFPYIIHLVHPRS
jgi:hypothetical protein